MTQENIQGFSAGSAFLHAFIKHTGLWVNVRKRDKKEASSDD